MVPNVPARMNTLLQGLIVLGATSCESTDHRLAEFAQRTNEQQVRQNERLAEQATVMVQQSQEVTQAAHDLVQQDAAARRELLEAHQQFQQQTHAQRAGLDRERSDIQRELSNLEHQRGEIDRERKAAVSDPVIGQAIVTVGLALAALVPLVLTALALRKLPDRSAGELLLDDFLLDQWSAAGDPAKDAAVTQAGCAPRLASADSLPVDGDTAA
jgi:hypothetical protein